MKSVSLILASLVFSCGAIAATAAGTPTTDIKFSFPNEEIGKVIEAYAMATGQRFVVDAGVRGRTTILGADAVSKEEAFNLLSDALAANGFAIRTEGETMIVQPARTVARSGMEVSTTLPAAKPERMVTYIVALKSVPADYVNRNFRFLPSKDGEMSTAEKTNSVVIIDWASNVQRIDKILKEVDKSIDPKISKMVDTEHKQWMKDHPHIAQVNDDHMAMKPGRNGPHMREDNTPPAPGAPVAHQAPPSATTAPAQAE